MFLQLLEGLLRNISGKAGVVIRRSYYNLRLAECGKGLVISEGVFIDSPRDVYFGENVWIDRNVVLMAGKIQSVNNVKSTGNFEKDLEGKIFIGSYSHLGIGTIIQGHGGVKTGNYFTTSAHCKIYTLSNDPSKSLQGTIPHDNYIPYYIISQIVIETNVWLGLNVSVLSGRIGSNTFIKPNSLVKDDIEENSIAGGNPVMMERNRF